MKYLFMALLTLLDAYAETTPLRLRAHVPPLYSLTVTEQGEIKITTNALKKNQLLKTEKSLEKNLLLVTVTHP